jgi:hypothetical protein
MSRSAGIISTRPDDNGERSLMLTCDIKDIGGGNEQSKDERSESEQPGSCRIAQIHFLDVCNRFAQCYLLFNYN